MREASFFIAVRQLEVFKFGQPSDTSEASKRAVQISDRST
jgi:hypothetical protein